MKKLLGALGGFAVLAIFCQPPALIAQGVYRDGALDARQHGFRIGYQHGFEFGQTSQLSNRDQDMINQRIRGADRDYQADFGSQELFRQGFGEGFRAGMDDSRNGKRSRLEELFPSRERTYNTDRNRNQNGPLDARQNGFKIGYRDGFEFGQNSQISNRDQDIVNQRLRTADRDYKPAFGSPEIYRQGYTEGFRAGMDDSRTGKRSRLEELFRSNDPNFEPNRNQDDRVYHGGALDARQHGFEHGYQEGFDYGRNYKATIRDEENINQRMRSADRDYQTGFGSQEMYRQGFSEGFRIGMEDSRVGRRSRLEELFGARDPNYDPDRNRDDRIDGIYPQNRWPPLHVATDIGYRDGFNAAILDRRAGRNNSQVRQHIAWQLGVHGYDGKSVPKGQYKNAYRTAYELGYRDGSGQYR